MRPFFMPMLIQQTLIFLLCLIGYLQPFHSLPWPSAIADGVFIALAFVAACPAERADWKLVRVPGLAVCGLVIVFAQQLIAQNQTVHGSGVYAYILVLGMALICYSSPVAAKRAVPALLLGTSVASCITALMGIGLWLGVWQQVDGYQAWISHAEPAQALIGNLTQPNLTGTLFIFGILSSAIIISKVERWNAGLKKSTILGILLFTVLVSSAACAITNSRTAAVNQILLLAAAIFFRKHFSKRVCIAFAGGAIVFYLIAFLLPWLKLSLFEGIEHANSVLQRGLTDNPRLMIYKIFLDAVLVHPLVGWGVGATTEAYLTVIPYFAEVPVNTYFGHTHNLVLEFLIWFGIPVGGGLLIFGGMQFIRVTRAADTIEKKIMVLTLLVFLVHAMLEYPLHHTFFLFPFVLIASHLKLPVAYEAKWLVKLPIPITYPFFLFLFFFLAQDYLKAEEELRMARLQAAIMGYAKQPSDESYRFVPALSCLNYALRTSISNDMTEAALGKFECAVFVYPTKHLLQKHIQGLRENGKLNEAEVWRARYLKIYPQ
jgi:O-antigen ligase